MDPLTRDEVARVFRAEYGRAVSVLVRALGSIDAAEDAVQEAFVEASRRWPSAGLPPSPAGWIITTARNRAIDVLRREATREERHVQAALLHGVAEPSGGASSLPSPHGLYGAHRPCGRSGPHGPHGPGGTVSSPSSNPSREEEAMVDDDRLRLIFTCCHPALARPAQVALTLRLLGGLTTTEIARAFLVPEATMAQRIVRAKAKIRDANIPYRIPRESELPERLVSVLAVVYLVFNEGYAATSGADLVRDDLSAEAIRLGRLLAELMPDQPEVSGLLALMLLAESRRPARVSPEGELVPLPDQDRSLWDRSLVEEGQALVRRCLRRGEPGPYQLQAAIAAVHSDAAAAEDTDWAQVVRLYDQLRALDPSPVVALNRAVAVAEVSGPLEALALVDALDLRSYYVWHAVRADFLARLGRPGEAASAYDAAARLTENAAERRHLARRRAALEVG
ncbi:MAG TPA: sigma-70 family RNA polymerase sigma factor [Dermatophilaceae bacterium]|nr:sigma-70 family RNA polymerase sigma factor [Dermatophilaceae bacterium]